MAEGRSPATATAAAPSKPARPASGRLSQKLFLVIGAGVAGLQTTRALLRAGHAVVVLEEAQTYGGVWSKNYQGYALQGEAGRRAGSHLGGARRQPVRAGSSCMG